MNAEIAELHGQGVSQRQIALQLGISRRQVGNVLHNRTEVNFILNDLHWPYQDDQAISVALKVADLAEPDIITLNGDVSDFYEISDFIKSKSQTRASIGEEIDNLRNFLASLRGRYPKARIVYIAGNHEYRWDRYIATNAQKIQGLRGISLEEQIGVGEQDIERNIQDCVRVPGSGGSSS